MEKSEKEYSDRIEEKLVEWYGEENIKRTDGLEETDRIADFIVETPLFTVAIEVENDFEATFKGLGQTWVYSQHEDADFGMILLPEGMKEEPEASMMECIIPIKSPELD